MTTELNNVDSMIAKAPDDAKKAYMERIWKMTKDQIFHELMRVHGESSKLLTQAQSSSAARASSPSGFTPAPAPREWPTRECKHFTRSGIPPALTPSSSGTSMPSAALAAK